MKRPSSLARCILALLPASFGLLAAGSACGPGGTGEAVRPTTPSAANAMQSDSADAVVACRPNSYAEPLVVDLSASNRVDFEAAMDGGVALVNYDCKAVRLLKDCRLAGDYKFAGVSRKEEVIHLDNRDEIKANLPLGQIKVGGEVERASALDIAYVLVGKRSTPAIVSRGVLEGSQCGEATHYIRAATVGAFAIQSSTKGRVAAAAEVFAVGSASGESSSAKQAAKKDGNPQACEQSKPGADAPPGECRSAIRFELVPVSDKAPGPPKEAKGGSGREVKSIDDPCPEGFSLSAGKCVKGGGAQPAAHLCAPKDVADCEAQCNANHPGSCLNLANLAYRDYGKKDASDAETKANETRAVDLWKKACDGGVMPACTEYGLSRTERYGSYAKDFKVATAALNKACEAGDKDGCYWLADASFSGGFGLDKDVISGMVLLRRACKLGDGLACREIGEYNFAGKYIARDPRTGDKVLTQFCNQGDIKACYDLGQHLLGLFVDEDKPENPVAEIPDAKVRGRALYEKTCKEAGDWVAGKRACNVLARILLDDNDARGRAVLASRCPANGEGEACGLLGRAMFDGKGGAADKAKGIDMMIASKDDDFVFRGAKALLEGDGVKADPARAKKPLALLCKDGHKASCRLIEGDKSDPKATPKPTSGKTPPKKK